MAGTFSGIKAIQNGEDIDLDLYQGKTINFQIALTQQTTASTAAPINLTGRKARAQFRKGFGGTLVTTFESTASSITINSTAGTLTFNKSSTITAAFEPFNNGVYDVELVTISTGKVDLIMSGGFRVIPETTI